MSLTSLNTPHSSWGIITYRFSSLLWKEWHLISLTVYTYALILTSLYFQLGSHHLSFSPWKGWHLYHLSHIFSLGIITYWISILLKNVATYITYYLTFISSAERLSLTTRFVVTMYITGCSCSFCSLYFATYTCHRYHFYNYDKSF